MSQIEQLKSNCLSRIESASSPEDIELIRVDTFGKKGVITEMMKGLGALDPEARKEQGQALNLVKGEILESLESKKQKIELAFLNARLANEAIDVTLTTRPEAKGFIHPLTKARDQALHILEKMGFVVEEGPDIENDFNNFSALNIPPEHPARQEQDTFYLPPQKDGESPMVLRTHTSPVQARTMLSQKPPIRMVAPGRTYRSDYDATHTPMFHQIEALVIDETTNMAHLKGCLEEFLKAFFENPDLEMRFRPAYFPFTEPSAEVDIKWTTGKDSRWLEVLGCGMVHRKVLENCGIDSTKYQGFAFGMGIERLAMLKYGINDLRLFFEADLRWLRHYGFRWFER